jgi:hypothetical protein
LAFTYAWMAAETISINGGGYTDMKTLDDAGDIQ